MKLSAYIVQFGTGFAPNLFGDASEFDNKGCRRECEEIEDDDVPEDTAPACTR